MFSGAFDIQGRSHYRHKVHGWEFVYELLGCEDLDLTAATEAEIEARLSRIGHLDQAELARLAQVARHTREAYASTPRMSDSQRIETMRSVIERTPAGCKMAIVLDHDRLRLPNGVVRADPPTEYYNNLMVDLAKAYPFVTTVSFSGAIDNDDQIQVGGNHYDRVVYLRLAQNLVAALKALPARASAGLGPGRG